MRTPFFVMRNNHVSGCGEPPVFNNDAPERYHGYFENSHGEQWVFVYDRANKRALLRGGDANWAQEFEVIDGRTSGVILGEDELQWLRACWQAAAAGGRMREPNKRGSAGAP